MKKYFTIIMLLLAFNLCSEEFTIGSEWEKDVFEAYQRGEFADILTKIEMRYREGLQTGEWQTLEDNVSHFEEEIRQRSLAYGKDLALLKAKKNQQLLEIANQYPDEFVAKVIKDIHPLQNDEILSCEDLNPKLSVMRNLIYMADMPELKDAIGVGSISLEEREKLLYSLELRDREEKNKKIHDPILKQRIANEHNQKYLAGLGKGKYQPKNDAEKRVAAIMKDYQVQQKRLVLKHKLGLPE